MLNLFKSRSFPFFFPIFIFVLFITTTAYTFSSEDFQDIRDEVKSHKELDPFFTEEYISEVKGLHECKNADVDSSIKYVWVLAGRSSYLKEPVDGPDMKDLEDDYNRLELGIAVAREVVAKLSNKSMITDEDIQQYGPQIIYNGRPKHNADFIRALEKGLLTSYPANKFTILDLDPKEWNSRGQFMSLKKEVPISDTSVAIVTHAYHFSRVARMIDSQWRPFGPNTEVFFYLVDRELTAPGIKDDLIGEIKRIPIYTAKGDLTPQIPKQIHY